MTSATTASTAADDLEPTGRVRWRRRRARPPRRTGGRRRRPGPVGRPGRPARSCSPGCWGTRRCRASTSPSSPRSRQTGEPTAAAAGVPLTGYERRGDVRPGRDDHRRTRLGHRARRRPLQHRRRHRRRARRTRGRRAGRVRVRPDVRRWPAGRAGRPLLRCATGRPDPRLEHRNLREGNDHARIHPHRRGARPGQRRTARSTTTASSGWTCIRTRLSWLEQQTPATRDRASPCRPEPTTGHARRPRTWS